MTSHTHKTVFKGLVESVARERLTVMNLKMTTKLADAGKYAVIKPLPLPSLASRQERLSCRTPRQRVMACRDPRPRQSMMCMWANKTRVSIH